MKISGKIFWIASIAMIMAAALAGCSEQKEIPQLSSKWMLVQTDYNIGEEDEVVIAPTFSSEEVSSLDFEWASSDPDVVKIIEDNNSSIVILGVSGGNAKITVECPGETKRLSAAINVSVSPAPLRILAIGNSFSQDAVEQYLWNLFNEAGVDAVIGNMYIGGCSLERHWSNAESGAAAYEYRKIVDDVRTNTKNVSLETAIADENWDYISLQQASDYSGMYEKYGPYLTELIEYVRSKATNRNIRLMFHQTWAYSGDSNHQSFPNYDRDQMKMYSGIVDASRKVMEKGGIDILVPSGTAIQNGRTSYIGDEFDRDGYHLNTDYGRFTAACTWYQTLAGQENIDVSVLDNAYVPSKVDAGQSAVARNAAYYAVQKPYEVTDMSSFPAPSE